MKKPIKSMKSMKKGGDNLLTETTEEIADIVVNTTDHVKDAVIGTVVELKDKAQETGKDILDSTKINLKKLAYNSTGNEKYVAEIFSKGIRTGALTLQASLPALEAVADETLEIIDRKIPKLLNYASRSAIDLIEVIPGMALVMELIDFSTTVATAANTSLKVVNKNIDIISDIQENLLQAKDTVYGKNSIFSKGGKTKKREKKKREKSSCKITYFCVFFHSM